MFPNYVEEIGLSRGVVQESQLKFVFSFGKEFGLVGGFDEVLHFIEGNVLREGGADGVFGVDGVFH